MTPFWQLSKGKQTVDRTSAIVTTKNITYFICKEKILLYDEAAENAV